MIIIFSVYFICFLNLYGKSEEQSSHLSLNSPKSKETTLLKITETLSWTKSRALKYLQLEPRDYNQELLNSAFPS